LDINSGVRIKFSQLAALIHVSVINVPLSIFISILSPLQVELIINGDLISLLYPKYIGVIHTNIQGILQLSNRLDHVHIKYHLPVNSEINSGIQDDGGNTTYELIFANCCVLDTQVFHIISIHSTFRK